jgi:hypothetical protein
VAIVAGGALLLPALGTLFRLVLGGRLGHVPDDPDATPPGISGSPEAPGHPALLVRLSGALFIAGLGFTNVADASWAHGVGAVCYVAFLVTAFRVALPLPDPT